VTQVASLPARPGGRVFVLRGKARGRCQTASRKPCSPSWSPTWPAPTFWTCSPVGRRRDRGSVTRCRPRDVRGAIPDRRPRHRRESGACPSRGTWPRRVHRCHHVPGHPGRSRRAVRRGSGGSAIRRGRSDERGAGTPRRRWTASPEAQSVGRGQALLADAPTGGRWAASIRTDPPFRGDRAHVLSPDGRDAPRCRADRECQCGWVRGEAGEAAR